MALKTSMGTVVNNDRFEILKVTELIKGVRLLTLQLEELGMTPRVPGLGNSGSEGLCWAGQAWRTGLG